MGSLTELLADCFERYEQARNDPIATEEALKDVIMGIMGACALGLEDKARFEFATHSGTHICMAHYAEEMARRIGAI